MNPWDQQQGESRLWYDRFIVWCVLGPERTLEQCWRITRAGSGGHDTQSVPRSWGRQAKAHQWEARAQAWDAAQPQDGQLFAGMRQRVLRQMRRDWALRALALGIGVMDAAHLDKLDTEDARRMVPQMRLLLNDLFRMQLKDESGSVESARPRVRLTADDFVAAEVAIRKERAAREAMHKAASSFDLKEADKALLVCVGPDHNLAIDLAMLRAVYSDTGFHFHRIENVTRAAVEEYMRRVWGANRRVRYVHIACHAGQDGLVFADGVADGNWLSGVFQGVEVLLLAVCQGDRMGDWLAVVPHVISMSDEISHGDAAAFTRHFWKGIATGQSAEDALESALALSLPLVREQVVRHW